MRIAIANHVPQQKETWRVTLTWPVINRARDVSFSLKAPTKSPRSSRCFTGPYDPETYPSQLIQPASRRITLLLDAAAAAALPPPAANGVGRLEITR